MSIRWDGDRARSESDAATSKGARGRHARIRESLTSWVAPSVRMPGRDVRTERRCPCARQRAPIRAIGAPQADALPLGQDRITRDLALDTASRMSRRWRSGHSAQRSLAPKQVRYRCATPHQRVRVWHDCDVRRHRSVVRRAEAPHAYVPIWRASPRRGTARIERAICAGSIPTFAGSARAVRSSG